MNILLVSAHFPAYDCPGKSYATPFLYNYAKEWAKNGANVTVVHFSRVYPSWFNRFAKFAKALGITSLEKFVIDPVTQTYKQYNYNGVTVIRIPFLKMIPHGLVSNGTIKKMITMMKKELSGFEADVMIGDCIEPVLRVCSAYKRKNGLMYGQIVHNSDFSIMSKDKVSGVLTDIDYWLFRSKDNKNHLFDKFININKKYLYFYSGIPETVIPLNPRYKTEVKKLLYVGALYQSKGLSTILSAMSQMKNSEQFLTVIGEGPDASFFKDQVKSLQLQDRVHFVGAVPHNQVFEFMKEADALLLISHETFGMVYVEAMSQACIPIGVVNDGIDGVVKDSCNGFLVPLGDSAALAILLDGLHNMTECEVEKVSRKAFDTGKMLSERVLADNTLDRIVSKRFEQGGE